MMMKFNSFYSLTFGALALLLLSGCKNRAVDSPQPDSYEENPAPTLPAGADALAVDMFRCVVAQEKEGNVVFSPASVEAVLLMLREGAAGQTRRELAALPYGKQGVPSAMRVESANALFAEDSLKIKSANAPVHRVPFITAPDKAADSINAWCRERTHGKIASILYSIPPRTHLLALNAVYLKEKWLRPFMPDATEDGDFHLRDGSTVRVPMMRKETNFLYAEGKDWQAVALFYRTDGRSGEPGCFIGILPKGDVREFVAALSPQKFNTIRTALVKSGFNKTIVHLPRFKVETDPFSLTPALQAAGVRQAFDERKADFTALAETATGDNLYLRDVVQKCYVEVNENGTEAAAVTAAWLYAAECIPPFISFNRPFLWVIGDLSSNAPPYFMGIVEKP